MDRYILVGMFTFNLIIFIVNIKIYLYWKRRGKEK